MSSYGNHNIKRRISLLKLMAIFAMFVLGGRLFFLQILRHDHYADLAKNQYYRQSELPAKRGKVFG